MASSSSKRLEHEDFLPAALEILESPPSPLGRILAFTIGLLFTCLIAWAWLSKIDVIVTGQGKLIPSGHVKVVQAFESGVVAAILVGEGERVTQGQALIKLDPTDTASSIENLQDQLQDANLDRAVAKALLSDAPMTAAIEQQGLDVGKTQLAEQQIRDNFQRHTAMLREFEAEELGINSQLGAIDIEIQKIEETLPILEQRVATAGTLLTRDAMRRDDRLSLQQLLIETRSAKRNHQQSRLQLQASSKAVRAKTQQAIASFQAENRAALREAQARINALNSQIKSESRRNQYRTLVAPVAGFVDKLNAHTIGGVVNAGEPVLHVVPADSNQEIEAFILNKDVGFVRVGDPAEIKLEAFPFTRYGVLDGQVTAISNDAIAHEQLGLVYKVSATIETPHEALADAGISVTAGMNVTLEVLTEKRRIIDYFISPLLRYQDEAIRER